MTNVAKIQKLISDYIETQYRHKTRDPGAEAEYQRLCVEKLLAEIRALHQPAPTDEKAAHGAMLAAGFAVEYDEQRGVHTYTGRIEHATKLLSAPPAMKLTAWATDDGRVATDATKQCMPGASRDNFNIPLYAEQSRLMLGDDTSPRAPARITLDVPAVLAAQLAPLAVRAGCSVQDLCRQVLTEYAANPNASNLTARIQSRWGASIQNPMECGLYITGVQPPDAGGK